MEKIINEVEKLTNEQKVSLMVFLVEDLKLKTISEYAYAHGKSYGGLSKVIGEKLRIMIGRTIYIVDNGQ